jgi:multiple sugar transport system permease protein
VDEAAARRGAPRLPGFGGGRGTGRPAVAQAGLLPIILFLSPAVGLTAILIIFPVAFAVVLSVAHWQASGSLGQFVALANYGRMLQDPVFWKALRITAQIFLVGLAVETVLGIGVGYVLSRDVPGRRIMQSLVLIPAITASVAIGLVWLLIYDPTLGIADYLLGAVGLHRVNWLGDPNVVVWSLILVDVWQWTPFVAMIVAAGIRSLPSEPFEAAAVDGASALKMGWHVGLPLLSPVVSVAILLRSVDLIRFFDTVYIMTQGGPVDSSTTLNVYGYRKGFVDLDMSYGASLQVAILLLVIAVAVVMTWLRSRASSDVA